MLRVKTLGGLAIERNGEVINTFASRKAEALLVYLACNSRAHPREVLAELLWDDRTQRQAMGNLRVVLSSLRKEIGPYVSITRTTAAIAAEADVWLDARVLETGVAEMWHREGIDKEEAAAALRETLALYKGDFLAGFFVKEASGLETWATGERERLHRLTLDALGRLARWHLEQGQYAAAIAIATQQVQVDPLAEAGHRLLMTGLARNGQRSQALAQYETCRAILAEELGMAPSADTTALYEQILSGDLRLGGYPRQEVRGYELKEQIGRGAFGAIYRAVQPAIRRQVAVKVIHRQYADDPQFIRLFEAEAQTIARLEHPYIVPLYDYWRDPQGAYLVTRLMEGGSLLEQLKAGSWNAERTADMVEQIGAALALAHRHDIVHGDVKPGNILLDEAGNAYLADFGIAKDLTGERKLPTAGDLRDSLEYSSPEQISGDAVTLKSDIYSLGLVLYETLTGAKPFGHAPVANVPHRQLHEPLPLVAARRPDIPPEVDAVLQKATARKPPERYASVSELTSAFRNAVRGVGAAGEMFAAEDIPTLAEVYNPYKGLYAFHESDADDFFGRETLVRQLLDQLEEGTNDRDRRFLAVVGPSGSGKSSVVKAGLIPALREGALPGSEKWFITEMVPGTNPLAELELALWRVAVDPPPDLVAPMQRDTEGILRTIRRILPQDAPSQRGGAQLLLVVDQFEELFTLVEDEAQRVFFLDSLLAALESPRSPLRVVVTLRADLYDRPLQYQDWGQLLKENTEVVLPLNRTELVQAIHEPARRMGVQLEDGLAAKIVADVADQPGGLPLLQYAMTELFERRENNLVTGAAYEHLGGVQGALGRRAEALYGELDESGQKLARQLFLRLVTLGEGVDDTRRRVLRSELVALQPPGETESTSASVATVLDRFGAARFLTFDHDPLTRAPTVEVAHEALLREWSRLRQWLSESRDDVRLQRLLARAAAEWVDAEKEDAYLLRGSRLDQFAMWRKENNLALTGQEQNYLDASIAARLVREAEKAARRDREARLERRSRNFLRGLVAVFALAAVVAGGLSILAFNLNGQSRRSAAGFRSLALAFGAEDALRNGAPDTALALAREAIHLESPPFDARQTFSNISRSTWIKQRLLVSDTRVRDAIYHPNGNWIVTTSWDGRAIIWDRATGQEIKSIAVDGDTQLNWLAIHPDQELIAFGGWGGQLWLWNIVTDEVTKREAGESWSGNPLFTPDGAQLIAMSGDTINIWDLESLTIERSFVAHPGVASIHSMHFNGDKSQLITASWGDNYVRAWDLATGELVRELDQNVLDSGVWDAQLLHNDEWLLTASDGPIALWNWQTGEIIWSVENGGSLDNVLIRDEEWFINGSTRGAQLYHTASGTLIREYRGHDSGRSEVDVHPGGDFFITGASDGTVIEWPLWWEGNERVLPLPVWDVVVSAVHPTRPLIALAQDLEGRVTLSSSNSSSIYIVNTESGQVVQELTGHRGYIASLAFTPDGRYLLSGDYAVEDLYDEQQLYVWDWESGERIGEFSEHVGWVLAIAVSPDGRLAASGDAAGTNIFVWNLSTGEIVHHLTAHQDWVLSLAFNPDGQWLYSKGRDGHVYRWDLTTGELTQEFGDGIGGEVGAQSLTLNADGTRLVASFDGVSSNTFVWDEESGQLLRTLPKGGVFAYKDGDTLGAIYSYTDGTVTLWDMETGQLRHQYAAYQANTYGSMGFSSDDEQIITAASGHMIVWDVPDTFIPLETWVTENRYIPDFTCDQRDLYLIEPLCEKAGLESLQ